MEKGIRTDAIKWKKEDHWRCRLAFKLWLLSSFSTRVSLDSLMFEFLFPSIFNYYHHYFLFVRSRWQHNRLGCLFACLPVCLFVYLFAYLIGFLQKFQKILFELTKAVWICASQILCDARWKSNGKLEIFRKLVSIGEENVIGCVFNYLLKCSRILSSRTVSGKFPTHRCRVSRTILRWILHGGDDFTVCLFRVNNSHFLPKHFFIDFDIVCWCLCVYVADWRSWRLWRRRRQWRWR